MSSWAKPGVKCICMHRSWNHVSGDNPKAATPDYLGEYEVSGIEVLQDGRAYLTLTGFPSSSLFLAERFRPAKFRDLVGFGVRA